MDIIKDLEGSTCSSTNKIIEEQIILFKYSSMNYAMDDDLKFKTESTITPKGNRNSWDDIKSVIPE